MIETDIVIIMKLILYTLVVNLFVISCIQYWHDLALHAVGVVLPGQSFIRSPGRRAVDVNCQLSTSSDVLPP